MIGTACLSRGYLAPTATEQSKKSAKDKEQSQADHDAEMNESSEKLVP